MKDKVVLITGATAGIGLETARELADTGATLVVSGRNQAKLDALVNELKARADHDRIHTLQAELTRQVDIHRAAGEFLARFDRLDVLINNAGAIFTRREVTDEGFERTWALNHLAYFLLTTLLRERLIASAPARVINVASGAHRRGRMHWDDLNLERGFRTGWPAYCQSKMANILFTRGLAAKLEGTDVKAYSLHPGFVATSFMKNNGFFSKLLMAVTRPIQRRVSKGADTVLWLATREDQPEAPGAYFMDRRERTPKAEARSDANASRLWDLTTEMTQTAGAWQSPTS